MDYNYAQAFVYYALKLGALELSPEGRKLKSGRISPYFFNTGLFKTGKSLQYLARAYAGAIACSNIEFDVLFGPAYKGIPLATAVAMDMHNKFNFDAGWAYNRKEEKNHGEGGIIVGASMKDMKICIIDDVMTSGDTAEESMNIIKKQGGTPVCYAIAFDRQERGTKSNLSATAEFTVKYGVPVVAAATLTDLIALLKEEGSGKWRDDRYDEILPKILAYRDQYGA